MMMNKLLRPGAFLMILGLTACAIPTHTDKGFEAFRKGDYTKAESELTQALKDNPNDPYAQLNLGAVYQNTNRPLLARPLFEKVLVSGKDVHPSRTANTTGPIRTLAEMAADNLAKLPPAQ